MVENWSKRVEKSKFDEKIVENDWKSFGNGQSVVKTGWKLSLICQDSQKWLNIGQTG
jgi:hypothetical protein